MKTVRSDRLQSAAMITLLLWGAILAVTGILGLIPRQQGTVSPVLTEGPVLDAEVFLPLPPQNEASVFSGFLPPLQGTVTSPYGYRSDPFTGEASYHKGVDIAVPRGTDVCATEAGTVVASAYSDVGGHYIILNHGNGRESYYGHLQTRTVSKGDTVEQGDIIGRSGATGQVTGPHLHFQLTYNERTVDPERYMDLTQ